MFSCLFLSLLSLVSAAPAAQTRDANTPICDFYTVALFKENSEANQNKLLTALVNTVVIGNFSATANGKVVSGILGPTNFGGESFDLTPFFTGKQGKTANINGVALENINFLDGGGKDALILGKPSNDPNSRQEKLLTHLYQLFASLTGCTKQGGSILPNYSGNPSMTDTHKFMGLNKARLSFFNDQVGQAALGFGVSDADAKIVGDLLEVPSIAYITVNI